ncbi:TonB-dependent hemoglobin/transferrin/lactoferrin family receptor [Methylopila sp. M107]|uniref:TonB-dependent hemoglobin/transferrin/lactoferrin family receptor n=1 Tax=Methylopila sp. M107 TaxID=1101190 RepID=UPI00037874E7|nr:TonB-dependent hemoglobin/transferrin/lactoferrin family receptor [Methylopila sp. M107]
MSNGGARRAASRAAVMACVLPACLVCAPARAQGASEPGSGEAQALEQIDVVGRLREAGWLGASDAVYETPGSVAEIGRGAIDARGGARNAADMVRGVAGVDAAIDRQNPGVNVNVRGLQDQGRVNMSIDGARQNFQQSGHGATAFAYVDPELISRIDIDKGPTSTAGGAGVIGGVVNFRTLEFDDIALPGNRYGVRLNTTTGTNAFDFNGSLAAGAKVSDAFEIVGAVGRKDLGEYSAGSRGKLVYGGPGQAAKYTTQDQWSWLLKATARPTDEQTVKLTYSGLDAEFGTGSESVGVGGKTVAYIDANKVQTHNVVGDYSWSPGLWWADVSAKAYFSRTANQQYRPARLNVSRPYSAFDVDYRIDTAGGSLSNVARFSVPAFDVAVTYGAEYFRDSTDTEATGASNPGGDWFTGTNPIGKRGVGGAFARAEFKRGDWLQVLLGGRYDRYEMAGSTVALDVVGGRRFDVDETGGRFSPTATVAVTPVKGLQVYGSYEQGYRPPNLMEAIVGGEHINGGIKALPNADLKPELSRTVEFGVNVKLDGIRSEDDALRAKASIYRTEVRNFITQVGFDNLAYSTAVNLKDRTTFRGLELDTSYDTGRAYIGGAANFVDASYGDGFDLPRAVSNSYLLGIYLTPKRKLSLDGGMRFLNRKLTVGGRLTAVKPEGQLGILRTGYVYTPYTLLDLYTTYNINETFTVRASIENLRDVAYVEAMGAQLSPSPGRTFTIGATTRF